MVLLGVLLSGIFFAGKLARLFAVTSSVSPDGRTRTYRVEGQMCYASVEDFMAAFDCREALDMAVLKFRRVGADVEIIGMNAAKETIVDKLAVHDKPGAIDKLMAH